MKRVPVIHAITKLEFGGAQQNTLYTVAALDRSRFEPLLISGPGGYLEEEALRMGVDLKVAPHMERPIRPVPDARAYRELARLMEPYGKGIAIVHTHSSKAGILGRWAARRAGIPVIVHSIHGFGFTPAQSPSLRWLLRAAEKRTSGITDHFIAVSESNRADGVRLGLFDSDRCSVIRSGFDLRRFREAQKPAPGVLEDLGIPPDAPVILMVACLKPQKAPLDFVRMAALVHRDLPEARFLLAGDGELRESVAGEALRLGLEGIFLAPGWREDVPELMKGSRAVVLSSRWEGLPRVIPQAKAAGRPVVATAVDGSAEAVRDGIDGFLCQPGDIGTMAQRVLRLLQDPGLAESMGREGARVVDEFDQDTMVRKQEELYARLLEEKGLW
ncbi:MAG: glycosyltransferase family 4 protein [bacterium]|nr:MAG: glycosyltransferase family 4 protein [bacterium]